MIIREYGLWVFLGEVLMNLELISDCFYIEYCGICICCIEVCLINVIVEFFVIDVNFCIVYYIIENRNLELFIDIKLNLKGWVVGCDIC